MKSVLIRLQSPRELICYEAISLAMTLASFDYQVQIMCELQSFTVLLDPQSRVHGMLKSLSLYDIDKAWLPNVAQSQWLLNNIDKDLAQQLEIYYKKIDLQYFDNVINF